jgi:[CysO sulfur-carrier protein]-S-L-cysteine hydrolase
VKITGPVVSDIVEHARADAPNECCGLLVGDADLIDECVRTRNVRASATRFLIDPGDHFATIRRLRGTTRLVVGAYHSHPQSPAVPSPTDIQESHYEEFVWLIVSLAQPAAPDVRAYRIADAEVLPLPLTIV